MGYVDANNSCTYTEPECFLDDIPRDIPPNIRNAKRDPAGSGWDQSSQVRCVLLNALVQDEMGAYQLA